jgi:hypothetical protein
MDTRYGRWTVLNPTNDRGKMHCKCDCGTERHIQRSKLIQGLTKSCGCGRGQLLRDHQLLHGRSWNTADLAPDRDPEVISGARFGWWTALTIPYAEPGRRDRAALCRCKCGTERHVAAHTLLAGRSRSCGCLRRDASRARHTN